MLLGFDFFYKDNTMQYNYASLCSWLQYSNRYKYARASEAGVCRGSDTPTIYVEGILICISPLKNLIPSHANCMQHVLRCWERQPDGAEYKKTLRTPLRELTTLPQTP